MPHTVAEEEDRMPALAVTRSLPILSGRSFNSNPYKYFASIWKGKVSIPHPLPSKPRSQAVPEGYIIQEDIYLAADMTPSR